MNPKNKENLEELFSKFLASEQAEKAAEEIKHGESLLRDNPAVEPDDRLVSSIKAEVAAKLRYQKTNTLSKIVLKAAAIAALFVVLAVLNTRLLQKETGSTDQIAFLPQNLWENGDDSSQNTELGILTAEVEQINKDLTNLQLGPAPSDGSKNLTEIEMKLIAIATNFWKG